MENFKEYFDTLPKMVQETLKQAGMQNKTEQELRSIAENLMNKRNDQ